MSSSVVREARAGGGIGVSEDFAAFYRARYSELAVYGWRLTRDPHVGDELAQEALSRLYARWSLLTPDPRAYAYRVITNLARDRWRQHSREQATWQSLVDTQVQSASDGATLDAIRRLPDRQRDAVLLHYYADLPLEDVARVLRRPSGTVKRWLHEARATLAEALQETP